jgi:hypothetical protein
MIVGCRQHLKYRSMGNDDTDVQLLDEALQEGTTH